MTTKRAIGKALKPIKTPLSIALNVTTDPSVVLGAGTAYFTGGLGAGPAAIAWGLVAGSAIIRTATELIHHGVNLGFLPQRIQNFLKNKGAASEVRGASYVVGAIWSALTNDLTSTAVKSKTAILSFFGGVAQAVDAAVHKISTSFQPSQDHPGMP